MDGEIIDTESLFSAWSSLFEGYSQAYNLLADEQSRKCFIAIIAARMFWHVKRLPLMLPAGFHQRDPEAVVDLSALGFDIRLKIDAGSQYLTFCVEQYRYAGSGVDIGARLGDIVIDGGGYVGDTALYFADLIGREGRVISFEFIRNNVENWHANVDRNPHLRDRITLVERPLWSESGLQLGFEDQGAASRVSKNAAADRFTTVSIDDIVEREALPRIDFLKLEHRRRGGRGDQGGGEKHRAIQAEARCLPLPRK